MDQLNPNVLSLWLTTVSLTYGITGDFQTSILALGIATAITTFISLVF